MPIQKKSHKGRHCVTGEKGGHKPKSDFEVTETWREENLNYYKPPVIIFISFEETWGSIATFPFPPHCDPHRHGYNPGQCITVHSCEAETVLREAQMQSEQSPVLFYWNQIPL